MSVAEIVRLVNKKNYQNLFLKFLRNLSLLGRNYFLNIVAEGYGTTHLTPKNHS